MTTVAVLGTGIMGAPMARNIARAGHDVRVWNRSRAKAEPLSADGAVVCATPAEAVHGAELVVTMLSKAEAVEETMAADVMAALRDDAVWLQMSTVGVAGTRRLAALAALRGIGFLDAPVAGTRAPAEAGQLTVFASGDPSLRERAAAVFDAVGSSTRWVADVPGPATALKLVNNSWVLAATDGIAEALALAAGLGLDPQLFLEAIKGGGLDIGYAHLKAPMMLSGEFPPSFPAIHAEKDAGLVLDAAAEAGITLAVAAAVRADLQRVIDAGHGDEDLAAIVLAHRPMQ